jgi:MOSC domain-containing protein YiiM
MEIVALVVSPVHRYEGRPSDGPAALDGPELQHEVSVRAHLGLEGDRYFGTRHRFASVTLVSEDEVQAAAARLGLGHVDATLTRRNIVLRGVDVESLVRTTFALDCGDGPIRFHSRTRANPCAWMDVAFGEGMHQALRGHAGIRAEPLDDGILRVGPVAVEILLRDDGPPALVGHEVLRGA